MSKEIDNLFSDFIGWNAIAGDFKVAKLTSGYHIQCGEKYDTSDFLPIVNDEGETCTSICMVVDAINQWIAEAKQTAVDAYNLIDHDQWEEVESWDCDDDTYLSQYIGSVMSLTPTGCYYTPFANSNVDIIGAAKDSIFWDHLESLLNQHGYWYENGEGNATDIFICKHKEN